MVEPEQLAKLRFIEERIGVPVGEQVRRGIDHWLAGDAIALKVLEDFEGGDAKRWRASEGGKRVARGIKRTRS